MSRTKNSTNNFLWYTISTLFSGVMGFVSRTLFINLLGMSYLGINSFFYNLLSMLSLAELGIGAAIGFSLYKPIAESDKEKIKTLMLFYKKAYQIIALIIFIIGLSILPFLDYLIKDSEGVNHIPFIFLIFLFNSAYSYLFTYKRTLIVSDQKSYLLTKIDILINLIMVSAQLSVLLMFENYLAYLLMGTLIGIVQHLYINHYINQLYPYLLEKDCDTLPEEEKKSIIVNVKALILHKIGDLSINQTDNIIIASFISITTVGIISNYTLLLNGVNSLIMNVFSASQASFGNLNAQENPQKKLEIFLNLNFLAFWFFGITAICLHELLNPFISLWLGDDKTIDQYIVLLIVINYFLVGMRVPLGIMKSAAGIFSQDKYVPLIQAAINLIASIILVQYLGLAGVFIGTILSSLLLPFWHRPIIVYKYIFLVSPIDYFAKYFQFSFVVAFNIFLVELLINFIFKDMISYTSFLFSALICIIVPNLVIIVLFFRTKQFKYVIFIIKQLLEKVLKK